jgi:hypothetical protein
VRVFTAEPGGVLRFSSDVYVCAARYGDVVLWHYAFARHWFKINLTTDLTGRIVETGDDEPGSRFAFNCDIATPMRRHDTAVLAVDLFADMLVRADAASYRICDLDELSQASRDGLILPGESRGAARGLAELTAIVERGNLLAFLSQACPAGPLQPPAAAPVGYVPLSRIPLLSLESRAAWLRRAEMPGMPAVTHQHVRQRQYHASRAADQAGWPPGR